MEASEANSGRGFRSWYGFFGLIGAIVAVVVIAILVSSGGGASGSVYRITSDSMAPTFRTGSQITVTTPKHYVPKVGDIVLFHPPAAATSSDPTCGNPNQGLNQTAACSTPAPGESSELMIKRVVAGPGDQISIDDGHVIRNGFREPDSSYTTPCGNQPLCNFPTPITIPPGDYFLLGDNRGASDDSRFWGAVPLAYIVGKVSG